MSLSNEELAERLYEIVKKYGRKWPKLSHLPQRDFAILREVVTAGGYKVKELRPDKLTGYDAALGQHFNVNAVCPFVVMDEDAGKDKYATDFLDHLVQAAKLGAEIETPSGRRQVIQAIAVEIDSSFRRNMTRR